MSQLFFFGREFTHGNRDSSSRVHMTTIHTEAYEDVPGKAEDDVTVSPTDPKTPHAQQWIERKHVFGSRLVLLAHMRYSMPLLNMLREADRDVDTVEQEEFPTDGDSTYMRALADRMQELLAPARDLGALKKDFNYILAYMPSWRVSYRLERNGNHALAIQEAGFTVSRPVYMYRQNSELWDYRRCLVQMEQTLEGRRGMPLVTFGSWDDLSKNL